MSEQVGNEERYAAYKRVKARRDLAGHAVAYVVVNAFLVIVWWLTSPGGYFWPVWVLAGWGIGLVLNAWDVLGRRPISEEDVDRELRRGQRR
ncbi:2TM domain-containing protein [Isoptericola sp. b441]|uniref:2TM domain-containing protein n=1 Tax=Actinotalea lenta TaxID=3064654 RepID=A0ABT9DF18_9CELL|nr:MULTISPECIES: 2TM domain-containing protein [unclassified Isoptericola]MDO8108461.1 2TM domain-containing protein [Isoptericola sp. b441]MDO8119880.1 2TM domain-containing protein [Isoptericola sp. b490]